MQPSTMLHRYAHRWRLQKALESALLALAPALLIAGALHYSGIPWGWWTPSAILGATVVGALFLYHQWGCHRFDSSAAARRLNWDYPVLEESVDLLLAPKDQLSELAALQQTKIAQRMYDLRPTPPVLQSTTWPLTMICLTAASLLAYPPPATTPPTNTAESLPLTIMNALDSPPVLSAPEIQSVFITLSPPAYTGLQATTQKEWPIQTVQGVTIQWRITFDPMVREAEIMLADGTRLPLKLLSDQLLEVDWNPQAPTLYQLRYRNDSTAWHSTDYFRIDVRADYPPAVEILDLPAYAEYVYDPDLRIRLGATCTDDYGIRDARLIATVTKGEGESVTFRNDTLRFARPVNGAKTYDFKRSIRLGDLQMEPGDELYLHFEALDNRLPKPQIGKTYKYIIAFADTTQEATDMFGGLAVNRMPEYFRSQRQIIIDTETLIEEERKLKPEVLQNRSNNIAADQKLLRLRYGKFLGEEFEKAMGPMPQQEHAHHDHEGHEHDHDHAHHDHEGHEHDHDHAHHDHEGHEHDHDHAHHDHEGHEHEEHSSSATLTAPELEEYYHTHDIAEEVTFFDAATAGKLRAALAQMWDAELHLRMGRPEKALPYEYRALKLIKEIQQASRIYVERIGFEPPEIAVAEKRLTGELEEIIEPSFRTSVPADEAREALLHALPLLERLRIAPRPPEGEERVLLQKAGEALAAAALEQPGRMLTALGDLRLLLEGNLPLDTYHQRLRRLQAQCSELLPPAGQQPLRRKDRTQTLEDTYLERLRTLR